MKKLPPRLSIIWRNDHFALFLLRMVFLLHTSDCLHRWDWAKTRLLLLISFIPFGNFYADRKWLAPENQ